MPETCHNDITGTFVMLPVELLLGDRCSPIALKLYCVLLMYCREGNTAWPGEPLLAQNMHISARHVRTVLAELECCALVTKEARPGTSNMYHVYKYKLLEAVEPQARTQPSAPPRNKRSHEVHEVESNKIYNKAAKNSFSDALAEYKDVAYKLTYDIGQDAASTFIKKVQHYGLSPRTVEVMHWQAKSIPLGQRNAFLGTLLEQAVRRNDGVSSTRL